MKDWVEALKSQRSHQECVRVVLRLLFLLGRATTPVSVWKLEEDVHPLKETDPNSTADADEGGGCPGLTPFTPNDARPIHTANTLILLPLTSSVPRSVGDAAADIAKDTMILDTDSVVIPENSVTDDAAISEDHVCLDREAASNISKSNTSSSCSSSYSPAVTSGSTTGDQHKDVDASCPFFNVDRNRERNPILLSALQSSTYIQSTNNVSLLSQLPSSSCSSSKSPSVTSGCTTFDQPNDDASCTFSKVNESRESYTIAGSSPPQTPLTRRIGQIFGSGDRLRQRTHAQIPNSHKFVDALHGKVMIV
jgi:hypothetical protein